MMKNALILIASAGSLLASPVMAKDAPPKADAAAAATSDVAVARKTRYCTEFMVTGSIIKHKLCRTRDEWLADGVDPIAK